MNWAHYILQVNIYLVIFYGFYQLFLAKETFFTLNRIYLLIAGFCSFAIPFLRFEWFNQHTAAPLLAGAAELSDLMTQVSIQDEDAQFSWGKLIVMIYLAGAVFCILRFVYQLIGVSRLLKQISSGNAFSFLKTKSIDQQLPEFRVIDQHEDIHIRQFHTLDVLFFELVGILTWFNPIIYFYKQNIKHIHEFLADEAAAKFQGNKEAYALLLLSNAFGVAPNQLTNTFFNKSLLKRRIFMLHKERSAKVAVLKYGLLLPLFGITLTLSAASIHDNKTILAVSEELPLDNPVSTVKEIMEHPTSITPIASDWDPFYKYMKRELRYPEAAQKNSTQGNTQVKFSLKNGKVEKISVVDWLGGGCDAEVIRSIKAYTGYKTLPNGNYALQVGFQLKGAAKQMANEQVKKVSGYTSLSKIIIVAYAPPIVTVDQRKNLPVDNSDTKIYDFVAIETQPGFEGGMSQFYQYLAKNVKYPKEAQDKNIQGKVFLSFIVEKDGSLEDITVERTLEPSLDAEAIRVLKASPKWIPGTSKGKAVRVKYHLPMSFALSNESKKDKPTEIKLEKTGIADPAVILRPGTTGATPLYLIDGVVAERPDLEAINPSDIESISVLKDASATAIYGERGKDGVILVTTKAGKAAQNLEGKSDTDKKIIFRPKPADKN